MITVIDSNELWCIYRDAMQLRARIDVAARRLLAERDIEKRCDELGSKLFEAGNRLAPVLGWTNDVAIAGTELANANIGARLKVPR